MKKTKIISIIMGILYYTVGVLGFFFLYIFCEIFGIITSFSRALFMVCFAVLPFIILILPIIIKKIFKKEFYKSILLSCIAVVIYFVFLFLVRLGISSYLSDFTTEKWNQYIGLRYLMVEDLDREYDFTGMAQDEVFEILGQESYYVSDSGCISYFVESEWLDSGYYCLEFDENNRVISTYIQYID